ncbi:5-formyltetrahydrofolate cyclo-ligase [Pseudoalteromonas distincta]|uniref:5-formyltetrahydrofolate cyclo-ligase n=1 Tax=Pseudoalteromonas TaxID=53246 RepID=UPI00020A0767|nr:MULTISPECIES: 5-formyltetrahydrofolate cyclo-ligase [Pseudoalteromonas]EGI74190.1 5-formyltetrahydrofolate cyclo-ligase [Pseudoalteromonas distincta]KAA1159273.1 5-formyltetrahydrofolate cyclo-ligase [Pseudoalteromonas distincta]MBB1451733.1 5-formyltetrahydrofolate cyclo-ligase [Pseudoalteromonas sp. SG43-1]MDC3214431.1 5-formyltetrahydrofolate cyclo-ligase [Pseudoalteromonas distincta]
MSNKRAQIRAEIRNTRKNLSNNQQIIAAQSLKMNFIQHLKSENTTNSKHIAIYLSNDGELDTSLLIKELWNLNHVVYLPIIHPFNGANLLFQRYEKNSPMRANRYGILEPKLNCSQICPLPALDYLLMPLVAFDKQGNRLGMGGGFYDRTLARLHEQNWQKPQLIGLAHECQKVDALPIESWDVPLKTIITPDKTYCW